MRLLSEFCHVACPWRRVVAAGCPAIPDQVEIVDAAGDRLQPGVEQPVRFIRQRRIIGRFSPGVRARRLFAAIAGHHERATGGAEPVIDRDNHAGPDQQGRRAERPVLQARRQWRRPDQQIGIRKRARRRRNQYRERRQRVRQDGYERRRQHQPRRNVIGAEGIRQGSPSPPSRRRFGPIHRRSAAAGAGWRFLDLGHQQRRLDHDIPDLCRRLEGDDDVAGGEHRRPARPRPTISSSR